MQPANMLAVIIRPACTRDLSFSNTGTPVCIRHASVNLLRGIKRVARRRKRDQAVSNLSEILPSNSLVFLSFFAKPFMAILQSLN